MNKKLMGRFNEIVGPEWRLHDSYIEKRGGPFKLKTRNISFNDVFAFNAEWQFWQKAFAEQTFLSTINSEYESNPITEAEYQFFMCMSSGDPEKAIIEASGL